MSLGGKRIWIVLVPVLLLAGGIARYYMVRQARIDSHFQAAQEAAAERKFGAARKHLKRCLALQQDHLPALLLAAQTARQLGDLYELERHLVLYRNANGVPQPLARETRLLRVQRLAQNGDPAEANVLYTYCFEHPEDPEIHLLLEGVIEANLTTIELSLAGKTTSIIQIVEDIKNTQRAIDLWMQKQSSQADQVQALVWRGRADYMASNYPQAIENLRLAVQLDPDNYEGRKYLAAAILPELPVEALEHLETLRRRYPRDRQVALVVASVLRRQGKSDAARQVVEDLLVRYPDHAKALLMRGLIALDDGKAPEAEQWLRKALSFAPGNPQVNLALSCTLQELGKSEEAQRYRKRFQELEPEQSRRPTVRGPE